MDVLNNWVSFYGKVPRTDDDIISDPISFISNFFNKMLCFPNIV